MTQTEAGARAGSPGCIATAPVAWDEVRAFLLCDRLGTQRKKNSIVQALFWLRTELTWMQTKRFIAREVRPEFKMRMFVPAHVSCPLIHHGHPLL